MKTGKVSVSVRGPWMWGECADGHDEWAYALLDAEDVPSARSDGEDATWLELPGSDEGRLLACAREIDAVLDTDLAGAVETVTDWWCGPWGYGGEDEELPATTYVDRRTGRTLHDVDDVWLEIHEVDDDDPSDAWAEEATERPLTPGYFGGLYKAWRRVVYEYMVYGPDEGDEVPDEVRHPYSSSYRCARPPARPRSIPGLGTVGIRVESCMNIKTRNI